MSAKARAVPRRIARAVAKMERSVIAGPPVGGPRPARPGPPVLVGPAKVSTEISAMSGDVPGTGAVRMGDYDATSDHLTFTAEPVPVRSWYTTKFVVNKKVSIYWWAGRLWALTEDCS